MEHTTLSKPDSDANDSDANNDVWAAAVANGRARTRQGWSGPAEDDGMMSDVVDRVTKLGHHARYRRQFVCDRLTDQHRFIRAYGYDMPVISESHWTGCGSTAYGYLAHSH